MSIRRILGILTIICVLIAIYVNIASVGQLGDGGNNTLSEKQVADDISVVFVNAGRADCILVQVDGHSYLIDTGLKSSSPMIKKVLDKYGVKSLDGIFLTHQHKDHIGGLKKIAKQYDISKVYSAKIAKKTDGKKSKVEFITESLGLPLEKLKYGNKVMLTDKVYFDVLGPTEYNDKDDNDNSLVLRMDVNGRRFLFTGDMQFAEERALMAKRVDVTADIYKISNHGNPDATLREFAHKVSPSYAIVTTDTKKDKDSANETVLSYFSNAKIYITQDYDLGILVKVDRKGNIMIGEA